VHSIVIDRRFGSISSEKNLKMILVEIQNVNKRDFSDEFIQIMKQIDHAFNLPSSMIRQDTLIKNWIKSEIKHWPNHVLSNQSENFPVNKIPEIIAVIKRTIYRDAQE
jgi:hypothetical protein